MSERIELLRALRGARKEGRLESFVDGLTPEQFSIIEQNLMGETAHRVSGTLVTSLNTKKSSIRANRWRTKIISKPTDPGRSRLENSQEILGQH